MLRTKDRIKNKETSIENKQNQKTKQRKIKCNTHCFNQVQETSSEAASVKRYFKYQPSLRRSAGLFS